MDPAGVPRIVKSYRLFVYGSLKRGFRHHGVLAGALFEGSARTAKGFFLALQDEYPALVRGGEESVEGEVFTVTPELLLELDRFEGCPDLYQREIVLLDDGTSAQSYVISAERARELRAIPHGRWTDPDPSTP